MADTYNFQGHLGKSGSYQTGYIPYKCDHIHDFLFLETKITGTSSSAQETIKHVTGTGQALVPLFL